MTAVRELPFGADTPDEFLAAYANGSLTAAERAEIDEWLAGHPEWAGRLRAYGAISTAVRQAAVAAEAPGIGSLAGLWAAVDAQPQARPLRPLPPPPPPPPAAPGLRPHRRRPTNLLLTVAAAMIVAVGATAVLVTVTRTDDADVSQVSRGRTTGSDVDTGGASAADEPADAAVPAPAASAPAPPASLPSGTGGPPPGEVEAYDALRAAVAATDEQQTAHASVDLVGVSDLRGTPVADALGVDTATATIAGTGEIELPDRAVFDTEYAIAERPDLPPQRSVTVQNGVETWVSCNGGPFVAPAEAVGCTEFGFGSSFTGPLAALDLLRSADGAITDVGVETLDGAEARHYRLDTRMPDETGEVRDIAVDVWIGVDDGLIHQVVQTGEIVVIVPDTDVIPTETRVPTQISLTYRLDDFGAPVDIPDIG